jgi:hypothetical protein
MKADSPWSAAIADDDQHAALGAYQESLPVVLIATPRSRFRTCGMDDHLSEVLETYEHEKFDHLPVIAADGSIVGILALAGHEGRMPVRDCMEPLSDVHLIGADSSILGFIRKADGNPFRLVVSADGISGLVSLSDLQQLPVRAALFAMVTHLEMLMAENIRLRFRGPEEWLALLKSGRRNKLLVEIEKGKRDDSFVDSVLFTQFCDKREILATLDPWNRPESQWTPAMVRIEALRNALAHANEYAADRNAARRVCEDVRTMDLWIGQLAHRVSAEGAGSEVTETRGA